jgi:hypothetical protein
VFADVVSGGAAFLCPPFDEAEVKKRCGHM